MIASHGQPFLLPTSFLLGESINFSPIRRTSVRNYVGFMKLESFIMVTLRVPNRPSPVFHDIPRPFLLIYI